MNTGESCDLFNTGNGLYIPGCEEVIYSSECKILQFGIPFFPNTVATSEEEVPVFTVNENGNMNQKPCVWSCCHSLGDVAIELQQQMLGSI